MREIKFRAWDKEAKEMVFNIAVDGRGTNEVWVFTQRGFNFRSDSMELMQYTSLKDKNGKEIWEGDIVTVSRGSFYHKIVYNAPEFKLVDKYGEGRINPLAASIHYEVIGNIYENPELSIKAE